MIKIKENYSLSNLNSFGFNHKAEYFSEVRSVEDCKEYIDFCLKKNLPITYSAWDDDLSKRNFW